MQRAAASRQLREIRDDLVLLLAVCCQLFSVVRAMSTLFQKSNAKGLS
jgi:hypothetical protein